MENQAPANMPPPVRAARNAIWRLYEDGFVDEDMATAGLLAVDLGTRRRQRRDREQQRAAEAEQQRFK
jgi:hypothetical protein